MDQNITPFYSSHNYSNIRWTRFIRPDGSAFNVDDGFEAMDAMGRMGVGGYVDNRLTEKYATPIFLTLLSALSAYAIPAGDDALKTAQETLTEGIGQISLKLLEENIDLRKRISLPAGTRITIMPLVDLWFKRPEVLTATSPVQLGYTNIKQ